NVVGRNNRGGADAEPANQPPNNKLAEAGGKKHAHRGEGKAQRAQRQPLLLAQEVGYRSRSSTTNNAPDERASRRPANAGRVQVKKAAEIADGAADNDIVVAEQQAAQRGDTGGYDQRRAGMRAVGGGQVTGLLQSQLWRLSRIPEPILPPA